MAVRFAKTHMTPCGIAPADETRALQVVELCGRTAYKSEDRITENSAEAFVLMLKGRGHLSVLEHGNAVLVLEDNDARLPLRDFLNGLQDRLGPRCAWHRFVFDSVHRRAVVGGNLRGWIETLRFLYAADPEYADFFAHHLHLTHPKLFDASPNPPERFSYRVVLLGEDDQLDMLRRDESTDLPRFIFKIVCDRGITHEIVRHRVLSFTQESTRYVNYDNKGMTLILPEELEPFYDDASETLRTDFPRAALWMERAETIFRWYREDLAAGLRPEIARDILPNLLKSEIFVSGNWSGWKHFIELRDSKAAHPRIRFLAGQIRTWFDSAGLRA